MASSPTLRRWLFAGLLAWGIGVQCLEALASAGMAICALGAWWRWKHQEDRSTLRDCLIAWWPMVAFLGWALIAPALAGRWPTGAGVARLLDWLGIPVAAYCLAAITPKQRTTLAVVCGLFFVASCSVAGLQHYGLWPRQEAFAPLAWTRIHFDRVYEQVPGESGRFMSGGLLFHRLKFAHVGGLAVVTALAWGLRSRGSQRVFALCVAGLGFLAIIAFPYARAAGAALTVSSVATLVLTYPRRWAALAALALVLAASGLILLNAPLRQRFWSSATPAGSGERASLITAGLNAVSSHPWVGIGLGRFRPAQFADPNAPEEVMEHPGKAHNQFVTLAAEMGVPGLLLFGVLILWLGRSMPPSVPEGAAGLSALLFFLLLCFFHDPLYHGEFSMGLALVLGSALTRAPMSRR